MSGRTILLIILTLATLLWSQACFAQLTPMESLVPKVAPQGWAFKDAPEAFTKETLFEHIDGQADLFVQYGFRKSVFAICRNANSSEDKIDIDIYDMGSPLHAFGVFSRFRQEEGSAGIGLDSFLDERSVIFYKGKYFVVMQSTESNPAILKQLAQEIATRISDDSGPPKELAYFPRNGLKPGSIEYFPDGLLGQEFLKSGFKASYAEKKEPKADAKEDTESQDSHLFLGMFDTDREAAEALKQYREQLSKTGSLTKGGSTRLGADVLTGDDPYQGKTIVVQKGHYLLGAIGFEHAANAEGLLEELKLALP
jgi:hypothetical protein